MRILFTFFGTRPHLYPLVPLAWACRSAGHEVRVATMPKWTEAVMNTGLPAVAVGGPLERASRLRQRLADSVFSQDPWPVDWVANVGALDDEKVEHLELVGRYLIAIAAAMVDDLVAFAREWEPDAVVYDSFSYAGAVAAAAAGVPGIRHLSGTDSAQRLELTQRGAEPLPEYSEMFSRLGLAVTTDATSIVDPTPPSLRFARHPRLQDMRYVPYNGPGVQPTGLGGPRRRPRVCVTWGHTIPAAGGAAAVHPYRDAIDAITGLGMDCLIATTPDEIELLGTLPDSARALVSAPLHLLVPYCDAIVHQGGDGTALTAATAALPQVVIAGSPEADLAGGRLSAIGAAIHLRQSDLRDDPARGSVIREAVARSLDEPAFRESAQRLMAEIDGQPTPTVVASRLGGLGTP
jgi:glycosyltransferase